MVQSRCKLTLLILPFVILLVVSFISAAVLLVLFRDRLSLFRTDPTIDTEVLILGAGMSGIIAAKTLQENGTSDFIILEAGPEIGGRMRKLEISPGVVIELGANWIEGIDPLEPDKHPLWALAERCGGLQGSYADAITVYNSTGHNIVSSLRNSTIQAAYANLNKLKMARQQSGLPDISVREALLESGWEVVSDGDKWLDWFRFDFCYAETPERTSFYANIPEPTYHDFGDPNRSTIYLVTDPSGYVKLVQCIADETLTKGDRRLHLNETVTEVSWEENRVCASTTNATGSYRYCGKFGISSFSLGVLQAEAVKFQPSLPQWKRAAIQGLDMTDYLKIFAEFPTVFWDRIPYIGYSSSERGYFALFISQDLFLPPGANILHITLTGQLANRVVQQPHNVTREQIVQVLRNIYGQQVPEPTKLVVAAWETDPLFHGSYSNYPLGTSEETVAALAAPVGSLYFTGEATSYKYAGFVHGAYFAGIDTANKVLQASVCSSLRALSDLSISLLALVAFVLFS